MSISIRESYYGSGVVLVDSPQFVSVRSVDATTTDISLSIAISTGDKTTLTPNAVVLTTNNLTEISLNVFEAVFEISKYISAFIEEDVKPTTQGYNGNTGVWYQLKATDNASIYTSATGYATTGYGLYNEGRNPRTDIHNGSIFANNAETIYANVDGDYLVPIYVGDNSTNAYLVTKFGTIDLSTEVTLNSADATKQIAYISVGKTRYPSEWVDGANMWYYVSDVAAPSLTGRQFNGLNAYTDLGTVPLLNTVGSYVEMRFKASDWTVYKTPFGFDNTGGSPSTDIFSMHRYGGQTLLQTQDWLNPITDIPTPNALNTYRFECVSGGLSTGTFDINTSSGDVELAAQNLSGICFTLTDTGATDIQTGTAIETGTANWTINNVTDNSGVKWVFDSASQVKNASSIEFHTLTNITANLVSKTEAEFLAEFTTLTAVAQAAIVPFSTMLPYTYKFYLNGAELGSDVFNPYSIASIPFYIGARNNGTAAEHFTDVIFVSAEFYNGVTTETYSEATGWAGSVNYGGTTVYSFDGGLTWSPIVVSNYSYKITCGKGAPYSLLFKNKFGSVSELPINGKVEKSISVNKKDYTSQNLTRTGSYDVDAHKDVTYLIEGTNSYSLNTGWISEDAEKMIEELMLSKTVWLKSGTDYIPIKITDSNKKYISRTYGDKTYSYTFSATESNPILNSSL